MLLQTLLECLLNLQNLQLKQLRKNLQSKLNNLTFCSSLLPLREGAAWRKLKMNTLNTEKEEIKYFFLRDKKKFPVACIASMREENIVRFAVSTHNPTDIFDKDVARRVAEGRLLRNEVVVFHVPYESKLVRFRMLNVIAGTQNIKVIPERAKQAAKFWVKTATKKLSKVA